LVEVGPIIELEAVRKGTGYMKSRDSLI